MKLRQIFIYYLAALLQGVCMVIVPAASTLLKSQKNGITESQYGVLTIPMILAGITGTLIISQVINRWGRKKAYFLGIFLNFLFLITIAGTHYTEGNNRLTFILLLMANAFLGSGVGIFVAILNILTINIAPEKSNSFLTGLHAFLGIGSAIAPQLVTLANQYGLWQASAFITAGLFTMILIASFGIFPLESSQGISRVKDSSSETSSQRQPFPIGAWVFLVMVFFYALIETTLNYWSSDYIQQEKGLGLKEGLLALSIFWAMVTVGRLGAALLSLKINSWYLYLFSPIIICIGIVLLVPAEGSFALYTYFLLGLGCSYFFPLSISLSASCFPEHKEKISSLSIASLFLSIGSCNYILGYLKNNSGIGLNEVFTILGGAALLLFIVAILLFFHLLKAGSISLRR